MLPSRHPLVHELEAAARELLPLPVYDYYAGGAGDETSLAEATLSWSHWRLRPRMLRDVSEVSTATTLLGDAVSTPIGVAPWAMQRMAHPDGEVATAAGAADAGALMTVSTTATTSLEDVATVRADAPKWFQLYYVSSTEYSRAMAQRAVAAGYRAIVLTVDLPVLGHRWRDLANSFELPPELVVANHRALEGQDDYAKRAAAQRPNLNFAELEQLVELLDVPVVVKGVLRADDARRCVEAGAQGVWVSTHGGRQVDPVISSADALGEIVEEVGRDVEVYADGGIRTPADVLIALALGARAVFLGRPTAWALTVSGAEGVGGLLSGFTEELRHLMQLCGTRTLDEVTPDLVRRLT